MRHPTIALAPGGGFTLRFEGHSVHIPDGPDGLAALKRVLTARLEPADRRIGTPSAPTQAQVDAWCAVRDALRPRVVLDMTGIDL